MLKKLILASVLFLGFLLKAHALGIYVAGSLAYVSIKNDTDLIFYQGLTPRAAIGVGDFTWNYFFLDLEAFTSPLKPITVNSNFGGTDANATLRPRWTVGVSALPGMILDDAVKIYLRFNAVRTNFDVLGEISNGYSAGAGIEAQLYGAWSARLEYNDTIYSNLKDGVGRTNNQEGVFSIVYRFGLPVC